MALTGQEDADTKVAIARVLRRYPLHGAGHRRIAIRPYRLVAPTLSGNAHQFAGASKAVGLSLPQGHPFQPRL